MSDLHLESEAYYGCSTLPVAPRGRELLCDARVRRPSGFLVVRGASPRKQVKQLKSSQVKAARRSLCDAIPIPCRGVV